ncbi:hypothetical protein HCUR_00378 [Holospora curviuscula]|uniref:Uncharacterized protein n=1 Tax=Holospora curviuscula TaxID=1082868 RepID=A0A2S5RA60_9PROT|nr:hypothetical protein HCUR_00378 [Holospora curviuscula]
MEQQSKENSSWRKKRDDIFKECKEILAVLSERKKNNVLSEHGIDIEIKKR